VWFWGHGCGDGLIQTARTAFLCILQPLPRALCSVLCPLPSALCPLYADIPVNASSGNTSQSRSSGRCVFCSTFSALAMFSSTFPTSGANCKHATFILAQCRGGGGAFIVGLDWRTRVSCTSAAAAAGESRGREQRGDTGSRAGQVSAGNGARLVCAVVNC
jgi:hypothetical protein